MEVKAEIRGAVPLFAEFRFARPVDWRIGEGENWEVAGPNGAGKTMLADLLLRRIPLREGTVEVRTQRTSYEAVRMIGFRDIYSIVDCREGYYQQRWNADGRAATPLAGSLFPGGPDENALSLFERFSLQGAFDKHIVSLSSGELRKLLVIRALCSLPEILVIDNPFVGLDESSRTELSDMLGDVARSGKVQFVLLVSDPDSIPGWVDMVLPVREMEVLPPVTAIGFRDDDRLKEELFLTAGEVGDIPGPVVPDGDDYRTVALLEGVTVRYGDKTVLKRVDWEVLRGQKWALLGLNGSGKSTLLSLLYGDNPQAYANRITLFDRRRGTGESIWDIKRRIGHLNSDIHSFYLKDISALEVVLSGFYDTVGLYSAGTARQVEAAGQWLEAFGAGHLAGRKFVRLSFGQQRLVMLARTFVKQPPVLILDEPMHGLDAGMRDRAKKIIEAYCGRPDVTLIYVTHYRGEIPRCVDKVKRLGR